uniref:Uncharacterized protein n=1 Tax=viral metagenome TaxID=1070528 RepID=A0A6M3LKW8_9ZZZZ
MYKDKGKQKEANREAQRKWRNTHNTLKSSETKKKSNTVIPDPVIPILGNTRVIPNGRPRKMPEVTQKDIDGLPQVVKDGIGNVLESRRRLGLPDDTEERWVRAAQYNRLYGDYLAI